MFEAGFVRLRELELRIDGLPPELDGVRIAHLSDFHLGVPSRGSRAAERAVEWVRERKPDLVCITGDLLARPSGQERVQRLVARMPHSYVVLGNHDFADSRDPFSKPAALTTLTNATLLSDDAVHVELRGKRVELAGVDPRTWLSYKPLRFAAPDADLRILLCHFPRAFEIVTEGRFNLILAGHLHAGQIVLPYWRKRRLLLAHPSAQYPLGVFRQGATTMHVSPGLGTTFVPFRFFARPEATELVLRSA
ncbi:MAG TPA: metallophosphoesterase [Gaiellaceae bacterium]|nr:metallophosphoesterase [Gaiellaceae bacterium]